MAAWLPFELIAEKNCDQSRYNGVYVSSFRKSPKWTLTAWIPFELIVEKDCDRLVIFITVNEWKKKKVTVTIGGFPLSPKLN